MSKFIDKLNWVSQLVPQPMGFRAAPSTQEKPRMLLIASLAQVDIPSLADYVAGADAGLLHVSDLGSGAKTLQKICQFIPDIPWGGWLTDIGRGEIKQMAKVSYDFLVFPAGTPLTLTDEVNKILQVEASLSEGMLRVIDKLPVDAVFIANKQEGDYFLTWHHLMLFQRFAELSTKPLLVSIPSDVTANELQALWEAGVDGVVAEVRVGQLAGRLKELHQAINKLTFPWQRRRGKTKALLPFISEQRDIGTEEEEE